MYKSVWEYFILFLVFFSNLKSPLAIFSLPSMNMNVSYVCVFFLFKSFFLLLQVILDFKVAASSHCDEDVSENDDDDDCVATIDERVCTWCTDRSNFLKQKTNVWCFGKKKTKKNERKNLRDKFSIYSIKKTLFNFDYGPKAQDL